MRDRLHVSTVEVVSGKAHTFEITPNDSVLPADHAVTGVKVAGQFRLSSVLSPESRKALLSASKGIRIKREPGLVTATEIR